MRIFDTKYFIDKNRELVRARYESLLDVPPDLSDPVQLSALLELKLYHLPPYFDTEHKTKVYLNNMFRSNEGLEYDLIQQRVPGLTARSECPQCRRKRQTVKLNNTELCTECWLNLITKLVAIWRSTLEYDLPLSHFRSGIVEGYEWFWDIECWKDMTLLENLTLFKQEFRTMLAARKQAAGKTGNPHSPKRTLLAATIGCTQCDRRLNTDNVWLTRTDNWMDGVCPQCSPPRGSWHQSDCEPMGYPHCMVCRETYMPYAMWGMCEICYRNWQDQFLDPDTLYEAAKRFGTTALLLVRPEIEWISYIRQNLPTSYVARKIQDPIVMPFQKPKIDIRSIVCSIISEACSR